MIQVLPSVARKCGLEESREEDILGVGREGGPTLAIRQKGDGFSGREGCQRVIVEEKMKMEAHSQTVGSSLLNILHFLHRS